MIQRAGDLFTSDAPAYGHGVNCQGVMGAGVAAIVRNRWPHVYDAYKARCEVQGLMPGEVQVVDVSLGAQPPLYIVNMATQNMPGPDATINNIDQAAHAAAVIAEAFDWDCIAIPRIGCGIGGLTWDEVRPVLLDAEGNGFQWEVWTL